MEITRDQFDNYRRVQFEGLYNMFSEDARLDTGLTREEHLVIIENYVGLVKKYGEYEE